MFKCSCNIRLSLKIKIYVLFLNHAFVILHKKVTKVDSVCEQYIHDLEWF